MLQIWFLNEQKLDENAAALRLELGQAKVKLAAVHKPHYLNVQNRFESSKRLNTMNMKIKNAHCFLVSFHK